MSHFTTVDIAPELRDMPVFHLLPSSTTCCAFLQLFLLININLFDSDICDHAGLCGPDPGPHAYLATGATQEQRATHSFAPSHPCSSQLRSVCVYAHTHTHI